jgi:hypothetical protein
MIIRSDTASPSPPNDRALPIPQPTMDLPIPQPTIAVWALFDLFQKVDSRRPATAVAVRPLLRKRKKGRS